MSKIIVVRSCSECPFFQQTTLGVVAALVSGRVGESTLMGDCGYPTESGLMHYPIGAPNVGDVAAARERRMRRLKILDGSALPARCPLYVENAVVTVSVSVSPSK